MKKIFKLFAALIFLVLICLSQPVKAQLSDSERQERCQNNKNRIAELEQQLQVINADLSASMTKKEMEDARKEMTRVRIMKNEDNRYSFRFYEIAAKYNFKNCNSPDEVSIECVTELEKIIAKKIDKAVSLDRPALLAKKKEIDQQIATHRARLITLDCDNQTKKSDGTCKLAGSWTQDTPGIGSTTWEIKSDGTADERGIGYAKGKATLNGNILHIDWKTGTGYSGYYEWTLDENCRSVKGTLQFKTGRTDNLNSTVKKN